MTISADHLIAKIDTNALKSNFNLLKSLASNSKMCVAVKANAYGHGVDIVAPILDTAGADFLGVANINEAHQLLNIGINKPILLFGCDINIHEDDKKTEIAKWIIQNQIRTTPMTITEIQLLATAAKNAGQKAYLHLNYDTGMSRMGLSNEKLLELIDEIKKYSAVEIEGIYTHLAMADCKDNNFSLEQIKKLKGFADDLKQNGQDIPLLHAANSAALLTMNNIGLNLARPGLALYGYSDNLDSKYADQLKPVMQLTSFITAVKQIPAGSFIGYGCTYQAKKDMTIAIVPIGYADGYDRRLSNKGKMTINGTLVPVIGRVSMDQTVIDITDIISAGKDIQPGQEVVVIDNKKNSPNSVEAIAEMLETIPYEITTLISQRAKRVAVAN